MSVRLICGDALTVLRTLPSDSVHTTVTSPPYLNLRSYLPAGHPDKDKEIGLHDDPAEFVDALVEVFREIRRVTHPTGTLWVNLGCSYAGSGKGPTGHNGIGNQERRQGFTSDRRAGRGIRNGTGYELRDSGAVAGFKPKDLMLMPFFVAEALRQDGWYLRSCIAWTKASAMPESVQDRPTSAWEPIFLFAKSARYFWDGEAVRQPHAEETLRSFGTPKPNSRAYGRVDHQDSSGKVASGGFGATQQHHGQGRVINPAGASLRNVWHLGPEPSSLNHHASFPTAIPRLAILAGTSEKGACPACGAPWVRLVEREPCDKAARIASGEIWGAMNGTGAKAHKAGQFNKYSGVKRDLGWAPSCRCDAGPPLPCLVLDPFAGTFTTCLVADRLGRDSIGIDLSPEYVEIGRKRIDSDAPLWSDPITVDAPAQLALLDELEVSREEER